MLKLKVALRQGEARSPTVKAFFTLSMLKLSHTAALKGISTMASSCFFHALWFRCTDSADNVKAVRLSGSVGFEKGSRLLAHER